VLIDDASLQRPRVALNILKTNRAPALERLCPTACLDMENKLFTWNTMKPMCTISKAGTVTPEEKRRFLAQRAQESEQRRALFYAETDAETT
jgi:hypothetical protein